MTPEPPAHDLGELERLLAEATPGPWRTYREHPLHHAGPVVCADGITQGSVFVAECAWDATSLTDVELIASGINALPDLIAVEKAATKVLHEYDLWAKDADDGEFAIWSRDNFMAAFMGLRAALRPFYGSDKEPS